MLQAYLDILEEPKTFYQYNFFIQDVENVIYYSIKDLKYDLMKEAYTTLNTLLKSDANCKLIIEDKKYSNLLSLIIKGFNNLTYCTCIITKLIKNDENNIINDNFQIYQMLLDIIMNNGSGNKDLIKHSLKMLRLISNNKNGYKILDYILNNSYITFFTHIQKLYFEKPNNLLL